MKKLEKRKVKNELIELIWKIRPESCTENNDGLLWTTDVIKTINTYFDEKILVQNIS